MNISAIFIRRPVATTVFILALVIAGLFSYRLLAVSELPNIDFPTIVISARYPGASPEVMASNIATPIEKQLSSIAGIDSMSSISTLGSTRITIQFDLARDIDGAAQDVQSALAQSVGSLPSGMPNPPTLKKSNPAVSPIIYMALTAEHLPLSTLDQYAETIIGQQLSMISGVAEVNVYGAQAYAVRISLNPNALTARGISMETIGNLIQAVNSSQPAGLLKTHARYQTIKVDGQLNTAEEYANQIITTHNNNPVRLKDIAYVHDSVVSNRIATWFNDQRAIVLAVTRQPGTNTVAVAQNIIKVLPKLIQQLPGDVHLQVIYDRSVFIKSAIHDVQYTLIFAAFLVILVMYFFLNNFSATVITTLALPTSIIATFIIMYLFDYNLDNLSLMGLVLAVGFVIDDAVVVLENITRHLEMGKDRLTAAYEGTAEVGFTVISMTISLVAVFLPLLFMGGIIGRLFHEFAVVVSSTIILSAVIALTFTPMLCSRYLTVNRQDLKPNRYQKIYLKSLVWYEKGLRWSLASPRLVLLSMVAVLALTGILYALIAKGFIPSEDNGTIFCNTQVQQGTTFPDFVTRQLAVMKIIQKNPNIRSMMSTVGQGSGAAGSGNSGVMFLQLQPLNKRALTADQVIQQLRREINKVPGIQVFLKNPPAIRIGGSSASGNYQYVLQGSNWEKLQTVSAKLYDEFSKVPGVEDVDKDLKINNPELHLHIMRDRAALLGITPTQIESALYTAYGDKQVTSILTQTDEYQVITEISPDQQQQSSDLAKLYLKSASGLMVPLTSVVEIKQGVGPLSVSHFGQLPAVTLSYNLAPNFSLGQISKNILAAAKKILPENIVGTFVGTAHTFQESMQSLPLLLVFTILIIYMVLAILYEHFIHPLTILTALPFAGFGALLVLYIFHQELDIFSFIGIIMLVGLVKKNGIMMIDFAIAAQRSDNLSPKDAIIKACLTRYRPIMMTTFAAILATLPIALGLGAGGESRRSMGIAVVGGLLFSQLFTLFVTPVFYIVMEGFSKRMQKNSQP
jgi:HAE1 family hydrophobic/amphiphilic exporter-1